MITVEQFMQQYFWCFSCDHQNHKSDIFLFLTQSFKHKGTNKSNRIGEKLSKIIMQSQTWTDGAQLKTHTCTP